MSYPLDHRGKLENEASYVLFDLKLRKTDFQYIKCLNMSWVLALPMCQEILMVIEILAYKINKFKTGHPVLHTFVKTAENLIELGFSLLKKY